MDGEAKRKGAILPRRGTANNKQKQRPINGARVFLQGTGGTFRPDAEEAYTCGGCIILLITDMHIIPLIGNAKQRPLAPSEHAVPMSKVWGEIPRAQA